MSKPWEAEVDVTPALATRLISEQFPELAPAHVAPLGAGWDNSAFMVNGSFVFRFPRRADALAFLEAELRVLPNIASVLPLPIPNPLFVGKPSDTFRWPFAGYRFLSGQTACRTWLSDDERRRCAGALGDFLRTLHSISDIRAQQIGARPDLVNRLDVVGRDNRVRENLKKCKALGLIDASPIWERIIDSAAPPSGRRTLVHGDLYVRHLLVDDDRHLSGIIDWGDCHVGSPAVDLSIVHSFLPPSAHETFQLAYGNIDAAEWALARWAALQHTSAVALFAVDVDDDNLIRECRTSFAHLAG